MNCNPLQTKPQHARDSAVRFLTTPIEVVFDLDGSLLGHNLLHRPAVQLELLHATIAACEALQRTRPIIATNKTAAELVSLGLRDGIVFVENCAALYFPSTLTARIAPVFPNEQIQSDAAGSRIIFGGALESTITTAKSLLEVSLRRQISDTLARDDWHVVAAAHALNTAHPEITVADVQSSFGLSRSDAELSATREGNTGIFLKSTQGQLLSFDQAFGKVIRENPTLWNTIVAQAADLGISFSASSKAVSIVSGRLVDLSTGAGLAQVSMGKGLAIELQRALSGGRPIFFAGDAGNGG